MEHLLDMLDGDEVEEAGAGGVGHPFSAGVSRRVLGISPLVVVEGECPAHPCTIQQLAASPRNALITFWTSPIET